MADSTNLCEPVAGEMLITQSDGDAAVEVARSPKDDSHPAVPTSDGYAHVKAEYIVTASKPQIDPQYVAPLKRDLLEAVTPAVTDIAADDEEQKPAAKRPKLKGKNNRRPAPDYMERKCYNSKDASIVLCPSVRDGRVCTFGDQCCFQHDLVAYLASRPPDIGTNCPVFDAMGHCFQGATCRYAGAHMESDGKNRIDVTRYELFSAANPPVNIMNKDLQRALQRREYSFAATHKILPTLGIHVKEHPRCKWKQPREAKTTAPPLIEKKQETIADAVEIPTVDAGKAPAVDAVETPAAVVDGTPAAVVDETPAVDAVKSPAAVVDGTLAETAVMSNVPDTSGEEIRLRSCEKRRLDWRGQLYLAPLTTVGNLPFRRVCVELGADITCGEMAMANQLLQGKNAEWALLKRHSSERVFGAQICGGYPDALGRCAQLLDEQCGDGLDFVDLNCGCPIDMVYKRGEGSALLSAPAKLERCVRAMDVMLRCPVTVKIRTGIHKQTNTAHNLVTRLRNAGASVVTLHGRSKEARYRWLADWPYIRRCAKAASPMPLFGNGDVLSWEDMEDALNTKYDSDTECAPAGVMIGRGALIKPWLFTELKERRHWDIRSSERFDILRRYTNYGLEHWGSDSRGVENTRRFLLEWLSFLHRYIPVGLLERLPQRINERPPTYRGRDDLETLMASPAAGDWVRITEMLLGPVPPGFTFLPKHQASAYK